VKSVEDLSTLDISEYLTKKSRAGQVGLNNLGNTCFMNSGLQCLSNLPELTKFFLLGRHKSLINKENPLGMGGKLAKAYGVLISEMWQGSDARTAPHDLKKTLGTKIQRFSGYGQQDSAELVNYILDLLHEDLN
jgi:ubiquitin C-terminal hydrolase